MTNEKTSDSKVLVLLGIIGLLGTVATGVFANWDKIFPKPDLAIVTSTTTPAISLSSASPSTASPSTPPSTPERSLNVYAKSLSNRNFEELAKIYPEGDKTVQRAWLESTNEESRITTVQVLAGETELLPSPANGVAVLRATMRYCRDNGDDSTDTKNYTFVQNQGLWQLESFTGAENVKPTQC